MPDNLKSGVTRAHRYEPDVNPTYQDLAEHYGVAVLPARSSKPRDKAKVEAGVLLVERWILAALRHRRFFSLDELNEAISALLERLNDRPFQKLAGSRRTHFLSLERPALRPLPSGPSSASSAAGASPPTHAAESKGARRAIRKADVRRWKRTCPSPIGR